MDSYYIKTGLLILAFSLPVITGGIRYRMLDRGSKIFYQFSVLGMLTELVACYASCQFHKNLAVYNIAGLLDLFLVSLYFNYTIPYFQKKRLGFVIGVLSVLIGIANMLFLKSLQGDNNVFLYYQAFVTVAMCLASLSAFLKPDDSRQVKKEVHFWFPVILMFTCCGTYLLYSLIDYYASKKIDFAGLALALLLINIISELATALVFFRYPKMKAYV